MNQTVQTMRDAFIGRLYERMKIGKNIFFLSADFGSPKLDLIRSEFPDRFINVGIAEQNLVNVAAGLALEGFVVYAYAIAPFLTMRAFEQIRNNLSLLSHNREVNVNLIGVGAGLSYDVSGPTHHCLEDLTIIRTLPNITLFSPSDWQIAEAFVDYSLEINKPKYLRFDGKPLPSLGQAVNQEALRLGYREIKRGENICLISTGFMTHKAVIIAEKLQAENMEIGVIDVFLLKPIMEDLLLKTLQGYRHVITLEEAFINKGGLDSAISMMLNKNGKNISLTNFGFNDAYVFEVGSREYLHKLVGLDETSILKYIIREVKQ